MSERVLPFVATEVMGCPKGMLVQQVVRAAIEFCDLSGAWLYEHPSITTEADERDYDFVLPVGDGDPVPPTECAVARVIEAKVEAFETYLQQYGGNRLETASGYPEYYDTWKTDQISFYLIPDAEYSIALLLALKPLPTVTTLDDFFVQHIHTLAAGAKFYLMSMPGQQWTNPQMAEFYRQMFYQDIAVAGVNAAGHLEVASCD